MCIASVNAIHPAGCVQHMMFGKHRHGTCDEFCVDRLLNITYLDFMSVFHNVCLFMEASVFPPPMDADSADSPAHQTCSKCRKSLPCDASNFKLMCEGFSKLCIGKEVPAG
jgi:hypothetical protein